MSLLITVTESYLTVSSRLHIISPVTTATLRCFIWIRPTLSAQAPTTLSYNNSRELDSIWWWCEILMMKMMRLRNLDGDNRNHELMTEWSHHHQTLLLWPDTWHMRHRHRPELIIVSLTHISHISPRSLNPADSGPGLQDSAGACRTSWIRLKQPQIWATQPQHKTSTKHCPVFL